MMQATARRYAHIKEADFRRQIVGPNGLATMLGWLHVGFRAAQTQHGWRTPVTGELGKGWPDLVLVRQRDRRLIFAELKADGGTLSPDQEAVLDVLRSLDHVWLDDPAAQPRCPQIETYVWRPADMDSGEIAAVLR